MEDGTIQIIRSLKNHAVLAGFTLPVAGTFGCGGGDCSFTGTTGTGTTGGPDICDTITISESGQNANTRVDTSGSPVVMNLTGRLDAEPVIDF